MLIHFTIDLVKCTKHNRFSIREKGKNTNKNKLNGSIQVIIASINASLVNYDANDFIMVAVMQEYISEDG